MSQVKDAGALEAGAEGLAEVVSAWDVPYQQLNDEDDGDTSPVLTAVRRPALSSIGSAGANTVRPLASTAPLKVSKVSTRGKQMPKAPAEQYYIMQRIAVRAAREVSEKSCLNGLLQQLENCEDEGIEEHVLLGRKQDHARAVVCESHGVC